MKTVRFQLWSRRCVGLTPFCGWQYRLSLPRVLELSFLGQLDSNGVGIIVFNARCQSSEEAPLVWSRDTLRHFTRNLAASGHTLHTIVSVCLLSSQAAVSCWVNYFHCLYWPNNSLGSCAIPSKYCWSNKLCFSDSSFTLPYQFEVYIHPMASIFTVHSIRIWQVIRQQTFYVTFGNLSFEKY